MVADQVVESREVFQPMDLVMSKLLGGCEVLEVLVVGEHKYDVCRALQVVAPLSEGLEDSQQLLIIDLVVDLSRLHAMGVEILGGCHHLWGRSGR